MNTLLFTPSIDTRFGYGKIASRIGLSVEAVPFETDFDFWQYCSDNPRVVTTDKIHCIFVDEAQFLVKAQVNQLCDVVDRLDIPVLTYGLRTDFRGEPFEGSQYLLALADQLVEIKGVCHCGRKTTMTLRVDAEGRPVAMGETIEIGGNERYVAVCRRHFRLGIPVAL